MPTPQSVLPILTSKRAPRELRLTCMSTFGEDIAARCNHACCTVSKRGGNAYSSKKGRGRLLGDVFARKAGASRTSVVRSRCTLGVSHSRALCLWHPYSTVKRQRKSRSARIKEKIRDVFSFTLYLRYSTDFQSHSRSHDIVVPRAWARVCA